MPAVILLYLVRLVNLEVTVMPRLAVIGETGIRRPNDTLIRIGGKSRVPVV